MEVHRNNGAPQGGIRTLGRSRDPDRHCLRYPNGRPFELSLMGGIDPGCAMASEDI